MQTSGLPTRVAVPFANSGTKNTIPVPSQIGITGGAASFTDGFPPLTMTPVSAGGIPPLGADFNGILNAITVALRWNMAGSGYPFDSSFSTTVSGYPKGALLPASDYSGYWINTQESNTTTPENTTSATTGWVPGVHYGVASLTGLSSSSVVLTTLQASKPRITLAGTLTANINLTFPAWTKSWTVVNNCTGAFSVTCKTPSGTGVSIPTGLTAVINGDGTNITQDSNILGVPGRFLNLQTFTSSGTYTPTAGTKTIIVEVQGAGGGGAGASTTSSSQISVGGGGSAGAYAKSIITSLLASYAVVVGAGGAAGNPGAGSSGGASSFGSLITSGGGFGGGASGAVAPPTLQNAFGSAVATGGNIVSIQGAGPIVAMGLSLITAVSGGGGVSILGQGGGQHGSAGGGSAASGYGGGGGGAVAYASNATAYSGAAGGNGVVLIWEYS